MKNIASIFLISILLTFKAFGSGIGLSSLTKSDFKKVNEEFAANKKHTAVSAASLLADDKKFEVSLIIGSSQSHTLGELSKAQDSSNDNAQSIPYVGLMGIMTLPKDLNAELLVLPVTHAYGFASGQLSGALKWSPKKYFDLPLNVAAKAFGGFSQNKWEQTVSSANVDVTSNQITYGLDVQFSKKFLMVEPYLNLGAIQTHGTIKNTGSAPIFDSSFSSSNEESTTISGLTYAVGAELDAWLMKVGVEYGEVYRNSFMKAKISTQF